MQDLIFVRGEAAGRTLVSVNGIEYLVANWIECQIAADNVFDWLLKHTPRAFMDRLADRFKKWGEYPY